MRYSQTEIRRKLRDKIVKSTVAAAQSECVRQLRKAHPELSRKVSVQRLFRQEHRGKQRREVYTCNLSSGYVFPGELFKQIDDAFQSAKLRGQRIDRVLLDNPGEWEDACPLLETDRLFAFALADFFKRRGVKVLVTNRDISEKDSRIIKAMMESVDTWIELKHDDKMDGTEEPKMLLRVERSPGMDHSRRMASLLYMKDVGLRVDPARA